MRIVLDAMGTDNHPIPDVAGAVLAARAFQDSIVLVGRENLIRAELSKHDTDGLMIEVIDAPDAITMVDKPSVVMKSKPQSSMHVGMRLVRDGQADAFVTMGNTGAAHAIATLSTLKRIPGIKRPALTALYPVLGREMIFLDVGANTDSKPEWLEQFAYMGHIYAKTSLQIQNPRVALLSNGEEEGKGNQLIHEAQALIQQTGIHFIGNIEPKEILRGGTDVVVMDGFVGNIFLKTFEAATSYLSGIIRSELTRNTFSKLSALLIRPALARVRRNVDTSGVGGAPLLGVNGVVIIGHGSANEIAVMNAIKQARRAVEGRVIHHLAEHFRRAQPVAEGGHHESVT